MRAEPIIVLAALDRAASEGGGLGLHVVSRCESLLPWAPRRYSVVGLLADGFVRHSVADRACHSALTAAAVCEAVCRATMLAWPTQRFRLAIASTKWLWIGNCHAAAWQLPHDGVAIATWNRFSRERWGRECGSVEHAERAMQQQPPRARRTDRCTRRSYACGGCSPIPRAVLSLLLHTRNGWPVTTLNSSSLSTQEQGEGAVQTR